MLPVTTPRPRRFARLRSVAIAMLLLDSLLLPGRAAHPNRPIEPTHRSEKPKQQSEATVGGLAPDFQLSDLAGKRTVKLSKLRGRPAVIWFGSYTCQPFRGAAHPMGRLYASEKGKASFFMVYTREAHPADAEQRFIKYTKTLGDRRNAARELQKELKLSIPILVDAMDDRVMKAYGADGARVYVIDRDGKVVFRTSMPAEFREVIEAGKALEKIL